MSGGGVSVLQMERVSGMARHILNDTTVTSLWWKRAGCVTEVRGVLNAIGNGCYERLMNLRLFLFPCRLGSVNGSGDFFWQGTCSDRDDPLCVGPLQYFVFSFKPEFPMSHIPVSSSSLFHSLFLSHRERKLPLWANNFQLWSLTRSGTLSWAIVCVRTACVNVV